MKAFSHEVTRRLQRATDAHVVRVVVHMNGIEVPKGDHWVADFFKRHAFVEKHAVVHDDRLLKPMMPKEIDKGEQFAAPWILRLNEFHIAILAVRFHEFLLAVVVNHHDFSIRVKASDAFDTMIPVAIRLFTIHMARDNETIGHRLILLNGNTIKSLQLRLRDSTPENRGINVGDL
jgi:hypothetical protein